MSPLAIWIFWKEDGEKEEGSIDVDEAGDESMMYDYPAEYAEDGQIPSPTSVHSDIVVHEPMAERNTTTLSENSHIASGMSGEHVTGEMRSKSEPMSPGALVIEEHESSPLQAASDRRGDITRQ